MIDKAMDMLLSPKPPHLSCGVDASFFRINDDWGFKFFDAYESYRARNSYDLQKKAHAAGLAPAVGAYQEITLDGPIKTTCGRNDKYTRYVNGTIFGYITECVTETIKDRYNENIDAVKNDALKSSLYYPRIVDGYNDLEKGLKSLFGMVCDLHWENAGWLKNGSLVCIDFSQY